jgi:hypothetical protein
MSRIPPSWCVRNDPTILVERFSSRQRRQIHGGVDRRQTMPGCRCDDQPAIVQVRVTNGRPRPGPMPRLRVAECILYAQPGSLVSVAQAQRLRSAIGTHQGRSISSGTDLTAARYVVRAREWEAEKPYVAAANNFAKHELAVYAISSRSISAQSGSRERVCEASKRSLRKDFLSGDGSGLGRACGAGRVVR